MIYDHHCLWLCLPELHTMSLFFDISSMTILFYVCVFQSCIPCMSLLFDISSMTFLFYVCVFQSSIVCPYCSTFHLWSPLLMFMSSIGNITSLMFDVSSMIFSIHASMLQRSNMVSCSAYYLWSSFFMLVCSRDIYHVANVWHIINDCHYFFMCLPVIQTVYLIFDISSMIMVLNVWGLQS